jgi:hypothetical protein
MLSTEHAKTSELIGAGMAIIDATLDRKRRDEKELVVAKGVGASVPFGKILLGIHTSHSVFEK